MTLDVITTARRRLRRLGIAVLVGVGVLAVAVYGAGLYVNAHLDDPPVPGPSTLPVPSPAGTASGPAALLPANVTWVRVRGVDLPVSPATGPAETVGGLARGFAHTKAGAVVAAVHLLVRTAAQVGPAVFDPTLHTQVVGTHAEAMRRAVTAEYTEAAAQLGVAYGQPLGDLPATVTGIRVDAYTGEQATLSVLTSAVDAAGITRYAATPIGLVWVGGDWRLVAPPDGRWDSQVRIVDPAHASGYPPLRAR